jgi:hypothetical protein
MWRKRTAKKAVAAREQVQREADGGGGGAVLDGA